MLVGSAGVGKTVFLNDRLACLSDQYLISKVPFNYYTTSAALQSKINMYITETAFYLFDNIIFSVEPNGFFN